MGYPMSFKEFLNGRICKGDQVRQDYEDYLKDCKEEEEDEDVCSPIHSGSDFHSVS